MLSWSRSRQGLFLACLAPIAIAAVTVGVAFAGGRANAAVPQNQSIRVAANQDIIGWSPYANASNIGLWTLLWKSVYQRLYYVDLKGTFRPELAAGFPAYVNRRTYQIKLKRGIRFSNGRPFTAADAAYSINLNAAPSTATVLAETASVNRATVVDPYTLRVSFKTPTSLAMESIARISMVPDGYTTFLAPIGTGPYVLSSYRAGQGGTLDYNPLFSGPKPQVTHVTVVVIANEQTRIQSLQSGDVDLAYSLTNDQAKSVRNFQYGPVPVVNAFFRINTTKPPFNDVRVRQAANYAVDKKTIIKQLFGGSALLSQCQFTNPISPGGDPLLKDYAYNRATARQLLQQAGAVGAQVTVTSPVGAFPQDQNITQAVVQYLNDAGFNARAVFLAAPVFAAAVAAGPSKSWVGGGGGDMIYLESNNLANNAFVNDLRITVSTGFASTVNNATFDGLWKQATAENNAKKRTALAVRMRKLACDQGFFLYIHQRRSIVGLSPRLRYIPGFGADGWIDYQRIAVVSPG
jgi:peptide/nickel transport system substrate-binding protein